MATDIRKEAQTYKQVRRMQTKVIMRQKKLKVPEHLRQKSILEHCKLK